MDDYRHCCFVKMNGLLMFEKTKRKREKKPGIKLFRKSNRAQTRIRSILVLQLLLRLMDPTLLHIHSDLPCTLKEMTL